MIAYRDCATPWLCVSDETTLEVSPPSPCHFFSIQLNGDACGDYTITVLNQ
jgi:hypothetical protein